MPPQYSQYLESKVLTAPPQRLHLLLIEGAIRLGRQAETELRAGNHAAAAGPLTRVVDIVGELLAGVRQTKSELNDKFSAVYWFIFRRVCEATIHADAAVLAEVLRLLEFERETWQKVCEKLGSTTGSPLVPAPSHAFSAAHSAKTMTGISLQA